MRQTLINKVPCQVWQDKEILMLPSSLLKALRSITGINCMWSPYGWLVFQWDIKQYPINQSLDIHACYMVKAVGLIMSLLKHIEMGFIFLNKLHSNIILGRVSKEITDVHVHTCISLQRDLMTTQITKRAKIVWTLCS